jgi:hypothetical protein
VTKFNQTREKYLERLFAQKVVKKGGSFRRSKKHVDQLVGQDRFRSEVAQRGFYLFQFGDQYLVLCVTGDLDLKLLSPLKFGRSPGTISPPLPTQDGLSGTIR